MRLGLSLESSPSRGVESEGLKIRFQLPEDHVITSQAAIPKFLLIHPEESEPSEFDAKLTVVRLDDFGGSLEAARDRQLAHKPSRDRKVAACEILETGSGVPMLWTAIEDRDDDWVDATLARELAGYLWLFGFSALEEDARDDEFFEVGEALLSTLEYDGDPAPSAPEGGDLFTDEDGRARYLCIPGWESQELSGQRTQYAPGEGFRARVMVSGADDATPHETLEGICEMYETISESIQAETQEIITHPLGPARRVRFTAKLEGNKLRPGRAIRAEFITVRRGEKWVYCLGFLAKQEGGEYELYHPQFLQLVQGLQALEDDGQE